jgi:8-oxo-dGTP diphosphatase
LNTNSHPTETPLGWGNFKNLAKKANFPVYALGGMSLVDLEIAKEHGAYGIAMISAINNLSLLK